MCLLFFFCKQKTAYEMRISDWSSDVCSSDLHALLVAVAHYRHHQPVGRVGGEADVEILLERQVLAAGVERRVEFRELLQRGHAGLHQERSDEHTSELQSLMRTSYAVFCLKKKSH